MFCKINMGRYIITFIYNNNVTMIFNIGWILFIKEVLKCTYGMYKFRLKRTYRMYKFRLTRTPVYKIKIRKCISACRFSSGRSSQLAISPTCWFSAGCSSPCYSSPLQLLPLAVPPFATPLLGANPRVLSTSRSSKSVLYLKAQFTLICTVIILTTF